MMLVKYLPSLLLHATTLTSDFSSPEGFHGKIWAVGNISICGSFENWTKSGFWSQKINVELVLKSSTSIKQCVSKDFERKIVTWSIWDLKKTQFQSDFCWKSWFWEWGWFSQHDLVQRWRLVTELPSTNLTESSLDFRSSTEPLTSSNGSSLLHWFETQVGFRSTRSSLILFCSGFPNWIWRWLSCQGSPSHFSSTFEI